MGIADRVHAEYDNLPHIHAFISLYALNPSPPTQPGALPALPTLLAATGQTPPKLITLYPSGSMISTPDSFASQLLTSNHLLLQRNLVASTSGSFVSIFIGHLQLPPLAQSMSDFRTNGHAMRFRERVHQATRTGKLQVIRDYVVGGLGAAWTNISGFCGIGFAAQDYANFERTILRALRSRRRSVHATGQYSWLPLFIRNVHPHRLNRVLAMLPTMPGATGPLSAAVQGQPAPRKTLSSVGSATSSTSSSDHEGGEDLVSSRHTVTSDEGVSVGSGNGMDASWVGVEAGN